MNALSLYVTTCRMIFQSGADDNGAWADIFRLLSYLRQAMSCCVCGNLLTIPMSSTVSTCQHYVCKACVGGKMRLKPSCSWCKDYNKFSENVHIRIMLQCYKKLCEYLISTTLHRKWGNLNGGTNINFADIVQEGAELSDEFRYSDVQQRGVNRSGTVLSTNRSVVCVPPDGARTSERSSAAAATSNVFNGESVKGVTNGNGSVYSVMVAGSNSTKIMIKRTSAECSNNDNQSASVPEFAPKRLRTTESLKGAHKSSKLKKRGCRCGMATQNPGKLTCCGQRCPCYVDGKPCYDCRCRGCRNPHKPEPSQNTDTDSAQQQNEQDSSHSTESSGTTETSEFKSQKTIKEEEASDVDIDG